MLSENSISEDELRAAIQETPSFGEPTRLQPDKGLVLKPNSMNERRLAMGRKVEERKSEELDQANQIRDRIGIPHQVVENPASQVEAPAQKMDSNEQGKVFDAIMALAEMRAPDEVMVPLIVAQIKELMKSGQDFSYWFSRLDPDLNKDSNEMKYADEKVKKRMTKALDEFAKQSNR